MKISIVKSCNKLVVDEVDRIWSPWAQDWKILMFQYKKRSSVWVVALWSLESITKFKF